MQHAKGGIRRTSRQQQRLPMTGARDSMLLPGRKLSSLEHAPLHGKAICDVHWTARLSSMCSIQLRDDSHNKRSAREMGHTVPGTALGCQKRAFCCLQLLHYYTNQLAICAAHPGCPQREGFELQDGSRQCAIGGLERRTREMRNTVPGRKDWAAWETASPNVAKKKKTVRVTWWVPLLMGPSPEAVAVMKLYMTCAPRESRPPLKS